MTRVLVFDVETTGLISKQVFDKPYIIQLSFIVYVVQNPNCELEEGEIWEAHGDIVRTFNQYIRVPSDVVLSQDIIKLTGITNEKCEGGIDIIDALYEFYKEYEQADTIVAHNLAFDSEMIFIEVERNFKALSDTFPLMHFTDLFNTLYNKIHKKELYCTMVKGKDVCNIWIESKFVERPRKYKKNPKLQELYFKLFGRIPDGLHDAFIDTKACLECYLEMYKK